MSIRLFSTVRLVLVALFTLVGASGVSQAQPDVVYTDSSGVTNWGSIGGIRGYSLQSQTCNLGDTDLSWTPTGPLLAMNAYRLRDGRLVQIGMSWVKNATFAIAGDGCEPPCQGGGGSVLGPGCMDVYSASYNGGQGILGPRSQVNAFTGAYPGPSGGSGNAIYKRLQIAEADLDPDEGLYFIEGHYVAADDAAAGNAENNASYKRVDVGAGSFNLIPQGAMFETVPGIFAWRDHGLGVDTPDPAVQVVAVKVPNEGRFQVAAKVTDLGGGSWLYDYAVRNHNSHRSGSSFSVPIPSGTAVGNVGFHDVDYHSGEPYDDADWPGILAGGTLSWAAPPHASPNALRFATMYNFWFEADAPPVAGPVTIGLLIPEAGQPDSVSAMLPVPAEGASSPAGSVLDDLTLAKVGGSLELQWGASCLASDGDYAVYHGTLGDWDSHEEKICSTGGQTSASFASPLVSRYYLVVPLSLTREGSYGTDSAGNERGQGLSACRGQEVGDCP